MTTTTLPTRAEIPVEFTWDLASIFPTPASWEASLAGVNARLTETRRFQGHLGEDAEKLADWLEHWQALLKEMQQVVMYAVLDYSTDTHNPAAAARKAPATPAAT